MTFNPYTVQNQTPQPREEVMPRDLSRYQTRLTQQFETVWLSIFTDRCKPAEIEEITSHYAGSVEALNECFECPTDVARQITEVAYLEASMKVPSNKVNN